MLGPVELGLTRRHLLTGTAASLAVTVVPDAADTHSALMENYS
jgi:hypothetical protein